MKNNRFLLLTLSLFLIINDLFGQDISGHWQGTFKIEGKKKNSKSIYSTQIFLQKTTFDNFLGMGISKEDKYNNPPDTMFFDGYIRNNKFYYKMEKYDYSGTSKPLAKVDNKELLFTPEKELLLLNFIDPQYNTSFECELKRENTKIPDSVLNILEAAFKPAFQISDIKIQLPNEETGEPVKYISNNSNYILIIKIKNLTKLNEQARVNYSITFTKPYLSNSELIKFKPNEEKNIKIRFHTDTLMTDSVQIFVDFKDYNRLRSYCYSKIKAGLRCDKDTLIGDLLISYQNSNYYASAAQAFEDEIKKTAWKGYRYKANAKTELFYKSQNINYFVDKQSKTYPIIQMIYGFTDGTIPQAKIKLDSLINKTKDSKAIIWKAFLSYHLFNAGPNCEYPDDYYSAKDLLLSVPSSFKIKLKQEAEQGNLESIFLLSQYLRLRRQIFGETKSSKEEEYYANKAREMKYYPSKFSWYEESLNLGSKRAAIELSKRFANKDYEKHSNTEAVKFCKEYFEKGDPDALFIMAKLYLESRNIAVNESKGIELANKAIKKGSISAITLLGNYYLNKKDNTLNDVNTGISYLITAAEKGDETAMFALSTLLFSSDFSNAELNKYSKLYWLEQLAKTGNNEAIHLLADSYNAKNALHPDFLKSKYWKTISKRLKPNTPNANKGDIFSAFFNHYLPKMFDAFEPDEVVGKKTTTYTSPGGYTYTTEEPEYAGIGGGLLRAGIRVWADERAEAYEKRFIPFNKVEEIISRKNFKIYAGTISSNLTTEIFVKKGQTINMKCSGEINYLKNFDGTGETFLISTPEGMDKQKDNNRKISDFANGSFLIKSGNSNWFYAGKEGKFVVQEDGFISVTINDKNFDGIEGYYNFELEVLGEGIN